MSYNTDKRLTFLQLLLICRHRNQISDRNKILLVPGLQERCISRMAHVHSVMLAVVVFDVHELVAFQAYPLLVHF